MKDAGAWEPFKRLRDYVNASDLAPTVRHVALVIGGHLNERGECFVSVGGLCRETGLGRTAISAAVQTLSVGAERLFDRTPGGARIGARYGCSAYSLRDPKGSATRGARLTRGSSSEHEGSATRTRGVRHAVTNDSFNDSLKGRGPELLPAKANSTARTILETDWAEGIGAPPRWYWQEVGPLLSASRPLSVIQKAQLLYMAQADKATALPRDFAQRVEHWVTLAKAKPTEEPYRATPEQVAAKSRLYGLPA